MRAAAALAGKTALALLLFAALYFDLVLIAGCMGEIR